VQYALECTSPNPCRGTATLRFALPELAAVELDVYDVRGRRVARLAGGTRPAGIHIVTWDARRLASGTYFVRLRTPAFTRTERVVLID
jgi:hypothetical protein